MTIEEKKKLLLSKGWTEHSYHPDTGEDVNGSWWILKLSKMVTVVNIDQAIDNSEIWSEWGYFGQ